MAYGKLGYSRQEFFDLSWYEFYRAAEGYYEDLKMKCPHLSFGKEKLGTVSDQRRKQVKEKLAPMWEKYRTN